MSGIARIALGALVAALIAIGVLNRTGGEDPYTARVVVADAAGIRKNSDVKVAGIAAGRVAAIDLDASDNAVLTLEFDESAAPIGADAKAAVRPVNLLGEKYIDLDPGDLRRAAPDGSAIPPDRTSTPVELDDVLNMLDPDTRAGLRVLIAETGMALQGRGTDFNQFLSELPPALDELRELLRSVAGDNDRLQGIVRDSDAVVTSLATRRTEIGRLIADADRALNTTAGARRDLAATIRQAPTALPQLQSTLTELEGAAVGLRPVAKSVRRLAPPLTGLLEELPPFAQAAEGTLAELVKTAPDLRRLARATPAVTRLRPTAARLATFAQRLRPVSSWLADGSIGDALWFLQTWARVNLPRDGAGHLFGAHVNVSDNVYRNTLDILSGEGGKKRPKRGGGSTPAPPAPQVGSVKAPPPVKELGDKLREPLRALPKVDEIAPKVAADVERLLGLPREQKPPSQPPGSDAARLLEYLMTP